MGLFENELKKDSKIKMKQGLDTHTEVMEQIRVSNSGK